MAENAVLLLCLDTPLQSWGVGAKGPERPTTYDPSLSGVVGLIANAQKRDRTDSVADLAALSMASRADNPGRIMVDFHLAGHGGIAKLSRADIENGKVGHDKNGVIGNRSYLSGAIFTVALRGDRDVLSAAAEALEHPQRILYLGRKSCPLTAPALLSSRTGGPALLPDQDLRDALLSVPLNPGCEKNKDAEKDRVIPVRLILPALQDGPGQQPRYDVPLDFSDPRRHYGFRNVRIEHVAKSSFPKEQINA